MLINLIVISFHKVNSYGCQIITFCTLCNFMFQLYLNKVREGNVSYRQCFGTKGKEESLTVFASHILQFPKVKKKNNKLGSSGVKGECYFDLIFVNCFNIYKFFHKCYLTCHNK